VAGLGREVPALSAPSAAGERVEAPTAPATRRRRVPLFWALVALVVVSALAVGVLGVQAWRAGQARRDQDAALAAARDEVSQIFT